MSRAASSRKECESRVDAALEPRDAGIEAAVLPQPPMVSKSRAGVGKDDVAGNAPKRPLSAELVFQNDACARAVAEQVVVFVRAQEAKGGAWIHLPKEPIEARA